MGGSHRVWAYQHPWSEDLQKSVTLVFGRRSVNVNFLPLTRSSKDTQSKWVPFCECVFWACVCVPLSIKNEHAIQ